ncbi:hypothetical protein [Haloferula sp.]|uniref:hypothetical protein n=1 Tax=Haloferula sp. TaxID=2497595 RepID=UPI00329AF744
MNLSITLLAGLFCLSRLPAATLMIDGSISTADSGGILAQGDTFGGTLSFSGPESAFMDDVLFSNEEGVTIELSLEFAGVSLVGDDDVAAAFPALYLSGQPTIDFMAALPGFPAGSYLQLYPDGSLIYSLDGSNEFEGVYASSPSVPEPSIPVCLFSGIAWLALIRNRQ